MNLPTMTPVESSQIESIGYDAASATLFILFKTGGLYSYADVPAETHAAFMAADSKGRFLRTDIKGKFAYQRLNP